MKVREVRMRQNGETGHRQRQKPRSLWGQQAIEAVLWEHVHVYQTLYLSLPVINSACGELEWSLRRPQTLILMNASQVFPIDWGKAFSHED